jgi:hypothetical protein
MVGYSGFGSIPLWTYVGKSNYNSLQVQLNRRTGRLQWSANYTWSKTINYANPGGVGGGNNSQWVNQELTKDVANRPHAMNFNFGYDLPQFSRVWSNGFTKQALDGWKINGNGAIYSGTPFSVSCGSTGAPAGYWTGTPTGGIPFRCQMGNDIWLPNGQLVKPTEDPKLQWNINPANFTLPPTNSLGIGNTPPTLFYGPGVINMDLSLAKSFRLAEGKTLEFRAETFNTLNHFNPNNPNTTLTYTVGSNATPSSFTTTGQTNANFGVITGAAIQARRSVMSLRFKF